MSLFPTQGPDLTRCVVWSAARVRARGGGQVLEEGDVLVSLHERVTMAYLLLSGEISVKAPDTDEVRMVAGDLFGSRAVAMLGSHRPVQHSSATLVALTSCEVGARRTLISLVKRACRATSPPTERPPSHTQVAVLEDSLYRASHRALRPTRALDALAHNLARPPAQRSAADVRAILTRLDAAGSLFASSALLKVPTALRERLCQCLVFRDFGARTKLGRLDGLYALVVSGSVSLHIKAPVGRALEVVYGQSRHLHQGRRPAAKLSGERRRQRGVLSLELLGASLEISSAIIWEPITLAMPTRIG